jgi:hypothetical protein
MGWPHTIYIAIFAFFVGFGFVWHIVWMAVVSIIGVIICVIRRTFNEDTEYTLTAAEVKKLEEERMRKDRIANKETLASADDEEDMGLIELIRIVVLWAWGLVRKNSRSAR